MLRRRPENDILGGVCGFCICIKCLQALSYEKKIVKALGKWEGKEKEKKKKETETGLFYKMTLASKYSATIRRNHRLFALSKFPRDVRTTRRSLSNPLIAHLRYFLYGLFWGDLSADIAGSYVGICLCIDGLTAINIVIDL